MKRLHGLSRSKVLNVLGIFSLNIFLLTACGGGDNSSENNEAAATYTVTTEVIGTGGSIGLIDNSNDGEDIVSLLISPKAGFDIENVNGCSGALGARLPSGYDYTTGVLTTDCTVTASFRKLLVTANADTGGTINLMSDTVGDDGTIDFTVQANDGYMIDEVSGCGALHLTDSLYTTGIITEDCTISASFTNSDPIVILPTPSVDSCSDPLLRESGASCVPVAQPILSIISVKTFRFSWVDVDNVTYYKLMENRDGDSSFTQVGDDLSLGIQRYDYEVPLYARLNAQYILQSCNAEGCIDSPTIFVSGSLITGIGYIKASNAEKSDSFGYAVSLSGNGNTLAVAAPDESSNSPGIDGDENNNLGPGSGAVYLFTRNDQRWSQQAYLKASNAGESDNFGHAISLSHDGNTLAVAAVFEASNALGVGGDDSNNLANGSGAVYIFTRNDVNSEANSEVSNEVNWSQQAYLKASNTSKSDLFGFSITLSDDGNTLAVGALLESSNARGVSGDENNELAQGAGAVYIFARSDELNWSQQAYLKASNTDKSDFFGSAVSLSGDGNTLAVGAAFESSNARGLGGDEGDNSALKAGAVYIFARSEGLNWNHQAYVKASNTETGDEFGYSVSLSDDGNMLAVGAKKEDSHATGIGGDENSNSALESGAVYLFTRSDQNWSQQAYLKASNTGQGDEFGFSVSLSNDGNTLAVGANEEDSSATGVGGDENSDAAIASGSVYLFIRNEENWSQQAYLKASNSGMNDHFGRSVSLSGSGETLAVGAAAESSGATGVIGNANDNSVEGSGAVYLY